MSESSDRERLVALLKEVRAGFGVDVYERGADAILAACEVRFREPEVDPRDEAEAMKTHNRLKGPHQAGWESASVVWKAWLRDEARRNRLARDAEWNAAIEAALGVARVKCWSGEAKNAIRALKREAK